MVNLLSGEMYLKTILENYLNERQTSNYLDKRQTMLKIPVHLPTQKTYQVEDPGAITYAKDMAC
jgi:hypothetical protein